MRHFILPLLALATLSGCVGYNPSYMPTGYTHHHGKHKGLKGPEGADIGYKYSEEDNEAHLLAWRYALRDLILKIDHGELYVPDTIKLRTNLPHSSFQASYDYVLREGLRAYSHVISDEQESPILFYSAHSYPVNKEGEVMQSYSYSAFTSDPDYPNLDSQELKPFRLTLSMVRNGRVAPGIEGVYMLPELDFVPFFLAPAALPLNDQDQYCKHGC